MNVKQLLGLLRDDAEGRSLYIEKQLAPGEVFYRCDRCQYERGFHVAAQFCVSQQLLICPSCGQWFVVSSADTAPDAPEGAAP